MNRRKQPAGTFQDQAAPGPEIMSDSGAQIRM